jgi:hypothetical protein
MREWSCRGWRLLLHPTASGHCRNVNSREEEEEEEQQQQQQQAKLLEK